MSSQSLQYKTESEEDWVEEAPGTEILYDRYDSTSSTPTRFGDYQHLLQGDSAVLLVPQPSLTDLNDPLRWSSLKKWATLCNSLAYVFLGAVTCPIIAAWMMQGSEFFGVTLQEMSYTNGATVMSQGVSTALWMPFVVKFGRRPVYLLSTFLTGCTCIWLGIASTESFTPFLIGRIFLGIWSGPVVFIAPTTITDIFFLHNRGAKLAMYPLSFLGGGQIGPLLSAFIIQYLGMDWAFYIVAIFIGFNLLTMVFFMPETKFTGPRPSIRSLSRSLSKSSSSTRLGSDGSSLSNYGTVMAKAFEDEIIPARSWFEEIIELPESDPDVDIKQTFLRPFTLLTYPTVLWTCLIFGMSLTWNIVSGVLVAQIFSPEPYSFSPSAQGLVFLAPFTGSVIGTYLCGPLADRITNAQTRRNEGIREPEFRLPVCLAAMLLTLFGASITGISLHYQTSWVGPVVGFVIISAGAQMGATLSMSYTLDCHKELSVELMVSVALVQSTIGWGWTWVLNDFLTSCGPLVLFLTIGGINSLVYLTTLVFYLRGKTIRIWLSRRGSRISFRS